MMSWYHNLPSTVHPIAFHVGAVDIRWYAIAWVFSIVVIWGILIYQFRQQEAPEGITRAIIDDMVLWAFVGAVIGGRIGYVFFYNLDYFARHPWEVISPVHDGAWSGISGMSFHGGALGVVVVLIMIAIRYRVALLQLSDFIVPAVPVLSFFGRIGNFMNHELYGRVTQSAWGMHFPTAPDYMHTLRHPSQLYESFLEGALLFVVLWYLRKILRNKYPGALTVVYLLGYFFVRFGIEFFREPDAQIGLIGGYTMGQILSLIMGMLGCVIAVYSYKKGYWQ